MKRFSYFIVLIVSIPLAKVLENLESRLVIKR